MIGTGDDSGLGLVTMLLYGAAALATLVRAARAGSRSDRLFWTLLCFVCVVLGVNKQADLQTDLIRIGRDLVRAGGLYEARRALQLVLFAGLAIGALGFVALLLRARPHGRAGRVTLAGFAAVIAYACLRAADAHHVLDSRYADSLAAHLVEPLGLALILVGAGLPVRRVRRRR